VNKGLVRNVGVGLGFALVGSIVFTVLPAAFDLTLLISGLAGSYVLYLLAGSTERIGRVTAMVVWSAVTLGLGVMDATWFTTLLAQVGMITLVRSLYHHNGLIALVIDAGLGLFATAASLWAFSHTGSLFVATWCFFLVQAAYVLIPGHADPETMASSFTDAQRTAEQAIARMAIR
jgi:hypothetical protein